MWETNSPINLIEQIKEMHFDQELEKQYTKLSNATIEL